MGLLSDVCVTEVTENSLNLRFRVFAPVNAAFPEPNKTRIHVFADVFV